MAFSGSRLVSDRLAAGLTQKQLAAVLETEQSRVSEWERGVMIPRPNVMPRLAAALGVDALEFLAVDPVAPTLEDLRLAAGLTMQEVAEELELSVPRYRGVETGSTRREPADEIVDGLARIFAVPAVLIRRANESARR